jgi:AhpC/TSA family
MNRREFLVAGSLGVMGAGCTVQTMTTPTGLTAVQERKAMPAFSLPNLDGQIVRSADLLGNAVILRFWATW